MNLQGLNMKEQKTTETQFHLSVPTCSFEHYAVMNSVTKETVRGWADKGHIPTLKFGRHRVVNLALLTKQALQN